MALTVPQAVAGQRPLSTPDRVRSELRWRVRLPDGRDCVIAQLLPELASDASIRRRYVRDCERLRDLGSPYIADVIAIGPRPNPRDPSAAPPWRARVAPPGESLEAWLERRAPAPIDEVSELGARLCDALQDIHGRGAVIRDLHPRQIVLASDGTPTLTDVGLGRVDVLSTRTAASLMLEGSPYASPEQLTRTTLDQRSDLYGLGVILFRALIGGLPFGDGPALLIEDSTVPDLRALRTEIPPAMAATISRCLAHDPQRRPDSAAEIARVLRGEASAPGVDIARTTCQQCGSRLRVGQRLCLSCGRLAVQLLHAPPESGAAVNLQLRSITEDEAVMNGLRRVLSPVSDAPLPEMNFLVGDARMYSKTEQASRIRLPATLLAQLEPDTAQRLKSMLEAVGAKVRLVRPKRHSAAGFWTAAAILMIFGATMVGIGAAGIAGLPLVVGGVGVLVASVVLGILGITRAGRRTRRLRDAMPLLHLRRAPAALPASDPLVARLATLLTDDTAADVREQVGELALLVQRVVDHRARLLSDAAEESSEIAMLTEPLSPLVDLIEKEVRGLSAIDAELGQLDEGALVRKLEQSRAREADASEHEPLLDALDRLRAYEDQRAQSFHRLLEASSLLRRAAELGLAVKDAKAQHERDVELAMLALSAGEESAEP